ncbi:DNA cytosine methyltransferase [Candidatus Leptofilum sp.]|uniref:DNA cytosine methyltransferase n=1 Tax=Candidatus Leptofilum sp. TaxID=3241576 RepID=UPI003B5B51FF
MNKNIQESPQKKLTFSDVFAGCGGLSLGLINAGWQGVFAVEKHPFAFETLNANLISSENDFFDWPEWFDPKPIDVSAFVTQFEEKLRGLKGKLTLLAGGPPCQGFSLAGERTQTDPRNLLIEEYIKIVGFLEPRILLIENVQGFTLAFKKNGDEKHKRVPYSDIVIEQLEQIGYQTFSKIVAFSDYGVPQIRKRFILVAVKNDDPVLTKLNGKTPFEILEANREKFLLSKGLATSLPVSVKDAIGDLEVQAKKLVESDDSPVKGFKQIEYNSDSFSSPFIQLMRKGFGASPNSIRLPRHKQKTIEQFQSIMDSCTLGKTISKEDRERLGINKRAITPLNENLPSATVTTLPDDILHYSEPRILTVRENARLQTFPDWFEFRGNYTTGGTNRKSDCPRYTQVGNAVPPLFAEAIGQILRELAS